MRDAGNPPHTTAGGMCRMNAPNLSGGWSIATITVLNKPT
jgi:hypothetical protein